MEWNQVSFIRSFFLAYARAYGLNAFKNEKEKLWKEISTLCTNLQGNSVISCVKYYFLDGVANMGSEEPNPSEIPIFALNSGGGTEHNHEFLQYICEKSGGKYFDLAGSRISDEDVCAQVPYVYVV